MEPSDNETQEEENGLCIEEHLFTLKTKAKATEETIVGALNRLKLVQHKVKIEMEALSETELRSKPTLRKWLEARQMATNCSFQEFFERFLDEHTQEYRLDISDRSLRLNKEACELFGFPGKDTKVTMVQVLEKLPRLYH